MAIGMLNTKETIAEHEEYAATCLKIKRFTCHADIHSSQMARLATWSNRKGRSYFDLDTFVGHLTRERRRARPVYRRCQAHLTRGRPATFLCKGARP